MNKKTISIENAIQRKIGLALEYKQDNGVYRCFPFVDMVPKEMLDRMGRFTITIEFEPNGEDE